MIFCSLISDMKALLLWATYATSTLSVHVQLLDPRSESPLDGDVDPRSRPPVDGGSCLFNELYNVYTRTLLCYVLALTSLPQGVVRSESSDTSKCIGISHALGMCSNLLIFFLCDRDLIIACGKCLNPETTQRLDLFVVKRQFIAIILLRTAYVLMTTSSQ